MVWNKLDNKTLSVNYGPLHITFLCKVALKNILSYSDKQPSLPSGLHHGYTV